jgi:hypothetical protein
MQKGYGIDQKIVNNIFKCPTENLNALLILIAP